METLYGEAMMREAKETERRLHEQDALIGEEPQKRTRPCPDKRKDHVRQMCLAEGYVTSQDVASLWEIQAASAARVLLGLEQKGFLRFEWNTKVIDGTTICAKRYYLANECGIKNK